MSHSFRHLHYAQHYISKVRQLFVQFSCFLFVFLQKSWSFWGVTPNDIFHPELTLCFHKKVKWSDILQDFYKTSLKLIITRMRHLASVNLVLKCKCVCRLCGTSHQNLCMSPVCPTRNKRTKQSYSPYYCVCVCVCVGLVTEWEGSVELVHKSIIKKWSSLSSVEVCLALVRYYQTDTSHFILYSKLRQMDCLIEIPGCSELLLWWSF